MSDLSCPPKPHVENVFAIADFAESECLRRADKNVSQFDIVRIIQRNSDGSSEEVLAERVDEAFAELSQRSRHCGPNDGRYPFELLNEGCLLQARPPLDAAPHPGFVYLYLLLATRHEYEDRAGAGRR